MKKTFTLIILIACFTTLKAQVPNCATNISPANTSTNINPAPYITLKWTPVAGAVFYNVYLSAKIPPTTLVGTVIADSFNLSNADYSTLYYWYVVPVNASGAAIGCGVNTTTFLTSPPPPAPFNDDCSGATDLSSVISGSTIGATQSQPADACGGYTGTADDDVWYQFTALTTGTVIVTMEGSTDFDGVLEVFKGNCGSLTYLTCSDTSQKGGSEIITVNALAGTNYKVRLYSFGANLSDQGSFTIVATGSALPISLIDFKGEHVKNNNILSWSTASELNNKGFQVEYSFNGKNFKSLGFVNSKQNGGNSSSVLKYQFTDSRNTGGDVYYRLAQIDKDGQISFSKVILVKGEKINSLSLSAIYPNPAKDKLSFIVSSPDNNNINIVITDLAGKTVRRQAFSVVNGGNNIDLDISSLSAGTYLLKADCSKGCMTTVKKFVKE
jgi:hypothetical protein